MKKNARIAYLLIFLMLWGFAFPAFAAPEDIVCESEEACDKPLPDVASAEEAVKTAEPEKTPEPAAKAQPAPKTMTAFERAIIEQGFRLLPYDHPFVIAYEEAYGVKIDSYIANVNGVEVSGVPFEFGGKGQFEGFNESWWTKAKDPKYPIRGLDCAGYIQWIYHQLGISVSRASTGLFFSGKAGVLRELPGVKPHYVLPSFETAMIGDVAYNSEKFSYESGHGSHTQLYIGTANKLGIGEALLRMYPNFPLDAHLVLDCGWSDGDYYYRMMKKLKVKNPRKSMSGVGVQFFTSIKSGGKTLYKSPGKVQSWKNPDTGHTFKVESRLEANRRLLQHKASSKTEYIMNLVRPVIRPDV